MYVSNSFTLFYLYYALLLSCLSLGRFEYRSQRSRGIFIYCTLTIKTDHFDYFISNNHPVPMVIEFLVDKIFYHLSFTGGVERGSYG